ncbi:MAG: hypothetical protein LBE18_12435, partial [Planctomycetaceae bacterium]|nr:hypothetical protein [Planctomycetaceae bacterium]
KRHDEQTIRRFLSDPQTIALTLELSDKFGEHGLIAAAIGLPQGDNLFIDTFLMSCRVLNRTAEHFLMNEIIEQATQKNFKQIIGEYIPTAKNNMVKDLFLTFGFDRLNSNSNTELEQFCYIVSNKKLNTFIVNQ